MNERLHDMTPNRISLDNKEFFLKRYNKQIILFTLNMCELKISKKVYISVEIKFRVSEWLLFNTNSAIFQREQVNVLWYDDDDDVGFVLDQHA